MKRGPVTVTVFHVDGQTNMMKLKIVFNNFYLDAPKNH